MTEALDGPGTTDTAAERTLGIMLVAASAAFFALTGVLTKSIHADPLTITCWRGFVGAILITFYVLWRRRRSGGRESLRLGWRGWLLALEGAAASIAFISAFKFTYVANVAVIYATASFITALLAFVLVREPFRAQTLAAAAVSLCGVAIVVGSGFGSGHLFGDGLALLMTAGSALYMIMVRAFRDTPVVWAGAVSALLLFVLGWFVTDPLAISARDAVLLVAFGGSFAAASILWTEGSRLIPAPESGLLGAAEVPFAILFAFLFLGEIAPAASLIGGGIVLCAVFAHAGRDWLTARKSGGNPIIIFQVMEPSCGSGSFRCDGSPPKSPQTPRPVLLKADRKGRLFLWTSAGKAGLGEVVAEQDGKIARRPLSALAEFYRELRCRHRRQGEFARCFGNA
ncbi:membrane protein [Mesorhizobium sp. LNJC386A00]|nr:membrane protein [Mesorhizobium sp. LNJC398B00]ESY30194.1 membrane protein [Mesorhizobium sp. LNJC386A00]